MRAQACRADRDDPGQIGDPRGDPLRQRGNEPERQLDRRHVEQDRERRIFFGEALGGDIHRGVGERAGEHRERRRLHDAESGLENDEDAGETEREHDDAPAVQPFAQDRHGEHGGPHRHGELDREYRRKRQHRDRVHPRVLAAEVQDVAHRVQAEAPRTQRTQAETRQDSEHQDERHEAPEKQGLEAPHGAQQLARRHGHHGERQHRAPHPQRAAQRGGQAVHRKSPRSSRREAQ